MKPFGHVVGAYRPGYIKTKEAKNADGIIRLLLNCSRYNKLPLIRFQSKKMNRIATDLKGITNWIFDLDDTLYPSSEEIFNQMAKRIKSFIMQALNVGEEEAFEIQKEYYKGRWSRSFL